MLRRVQWKCRTQERVSVGSSVFLLCGSSTGVHASADTMLFSMHCMLMQCFSTCSHEIHAALLRSPRGP